MTTEPFVVFAAAPMNYGSVCEMRRCQHRAILRHCGSCDCLVCAVHVRRPGLHRRFAHMGLPQTLKLSRERRFVPSRIRLL